MNHVVIFAGGVGSRMGTVNCPKQFLKLDGKEIIVYTVEKFQAHPEVDAIYIACHPDWIDFMKSLVERYSLSKVVSVVAGGQTGQMSIYNGLAEAERFRRGREDIVLIHDGVRVLEMDVGYDFCLSSDSDMSRCLEGHIFSDYFQRLSENSPPRFLLL